MREFVKGERMFFSKKAVIIISFLFLLCVSFGQQTALANGKAAVQPLVETTWLVENLKNPDLRLVYVGGLGEKDKENFDSSHIQGSVYISVGTLMGILGDGSTLPNKAKFEELMGKLGISSKNHVVFYGSSGENPFITGALWLMKYNGHKAISYLNGGFKKWTAEKRETTAESAKTAPATYSAVPHEEIRADADYVLKNIKNPNVVIVDARSPEEYNGTNAMGNKRVGHVPGAVNLDYITTNLDKDGTFKSVDELKAVYKAKGITKDKEVIVYCLGGVRAGHTYFVLQSLLGYPNVRNYVGSMGEWSNKLDPAKYPLEK